MILVYWIKRSYNEEGEKAGMKNLFMCHRRKSLGRNSPDGSHVMAMTLIMEAGIFQICSWSIAFVVRGDITRYLFIWSAFLSESLYQKNAFLSRWISLSKCSQTWKNYFKITNLTLRICIFVYLIAVLLPVFGAQHREWQVTGMDCHRLCTVGSIFLLYSDRIRIVQRWFAGVAYLLEKKRSH